MDTCGVFGENKMEESHDMKNMEEEVHQFQKRVVPEIFLSNIVTIGILLLSFYDYLPWKIAGSEGQKHVSLKDRFMFTLQLSFIDIIPVLICVFAVFNRRRQTLAINPMDRRGEKYVERVKGILENTWNNLLLNLYCH